MKEKDPIPAAEPASRIVSQSIVEEMRASYLDYAMSVITARALPDVKDGLKPVHRRILYAMRQNGLTASAKFRKSATVVGDVLGSYHPHGDASVYDAMVKLAQEFSTRYPLVLGQGNFGSVDGDPPAAYRYTEAKMTRLTDELLRDLDKDTVAWAPNYDATKKEPTVLPAAFPNLLANGGLGIAVGMATNIPPHNLREIIDASVYLLDNPGASTDELLEFVKGPDFPLGGIAYNAKDIAHAYATGKGGVVVRGDAEIVEDKKGFSIVITSIPFRANKADLIAHIAELVSEKKLEGIKDLRDESAADIRIVVELKGTAHPQSVLNNLYKYTGLEETFHYNMVALVDGVPQTLSLKGMLEQFLIHRKEVVRRRTEFDLARAREREHILLGLKKALDIIDEIITAIREAKDVPTAHEALTKKFKFSDLQATAILEMRLQKLAGLERQKIEDELTETQTFIAECEDLLASTKKMERVIKKELAEVSEKFGDDRRTRIVKGGAKAFSMEDLVPDEDTVLVLTKGGYVKRTSPNEYRRQKRGGVGVIDLETKEEDVVETLITASAHADLLFFSDRGKAYQIKMYEIPEGKRATKGKAIQNYLQIGSDERITSVLPVPKGAELAASSLLLATAGGVVKKSAAKAFADVRRSGIIAITLKGDDRLIAARLVKEGDEVSFVSRKGQSIRFSEGDVREMGRAAGGVAGMRLVKGDVVVSADVIPAESMKDATLLVLTAEGYGKLTDMEEYKTQKRAGSGIKTGAVTGKTGDIIGAKVLIGDKERYELVVISKKGQIIRMALADVPVQGRATQGVRVMRMRESDKLASMVAIEVEEES